MEPESSLPYTQVPATRPYPEPTPSSPHDSLQLPEGPDIEGYRKQIFLTQVRLVFPTGYTYWFPPF
jgi:hypothetical protein